MVAQSSTKNKFKCETCGKTFNSNLELGGHKQSHRTLIKGSILSKFKVIDIEDMRTIPQRTKASNIGSLVEELFVEMKDYPAYRGKRLKVDESLFKPASLLTGLRNKFKGTDYKVSLRDMTKSPDKDLQGWWLDVWRAY